MKPIRFFVDGYPIEMGYLVETPQKEGKMKTRYCPHCGDEISQNNLDGELMSRTHYRSLLCCRKPKCVAKAKEENQIAYPTRYCVFNQPIPKVSDGGYPVSNSAYKLRKVCADPDCGCRNPSKVTAFNAERAEAAISRFIYGR